MTTPPVWSSVAEFSIALPGDVVYLQAQIRRLAQQAGFGEVERTSIAIAASELATNILKYAGRGRILFRRSDQPVRLEIEALDEGPGFADIAHALEDGHSDDRDARTGEWKPGHRGIGCGLGAVARLMDTLEVRNRPSGGAQVVAAKQLRSAPR